MHSGVVECRAFLPRWSYFQVRLVSPDMLWAASVVSMQVPLDDMLSPSVARRPAGGLVGHAGEVIGGCGVGGWVSQALCQ